MEHQDIPISSHQERIEREFVTIGKYAFRKSFIAAGIFFLLLWGGNLWTLSALQNRQSEALQKQIALLAEEVRQIHNTSALPEKGLLARAVPEPAEKAAAGQTQDTPVPAPAAEAPAETAVMAAASPTPISQANPEPVAPVVALASPEASGQALGAEEEKKGLALSGAPARKAHIALARPLEKQETMREPEAAAPVKHYGVRAKIKKAARYSGGLFIASPDERNKEELRQETEDYLEHVGNLPAGKPVPGAIVSNFGRRSDPVNNRRAFHNGVDFQGKIGDPIRTTADGKVLHSGYSRDYGEYIVVSHGQGMETLYAHMSKRLIETGRLVRRGQKIGLIGSTGRSTGPHLHYEVRHGGKTVNPVQYIEFAGTQRSAKVLAAARRTAGKSGDTSGKSRASAKFKNKKVTEKKAE